MADNEINISVQTQQQNINATPSVQQSNIGVNYTFENVLWGRILGNINNQSDLITLFGTKQDTISDLASIRAGAVLGATSVQPADLATVATTGDYEDLLNKPTIPTDTEDLTNGAGYQTAEDVSVSISTKANVDLSNLSATGENHFVQLQNGVAQADVDYVVETYKNGTSWYRLYKSGWCEQGGLASVASASSTAVTLLKSFNDLNYSLLITSNSAWYGEGEANNTAIKTSVSQITLWNGSHIASDFTWVAMGYIS